ncbi:MAG: ferredoxin reductase [Actinobacteria bacterium]|nr:ferredoxin reductase [Actinomycetota bacterium]
MEGTALLGRLIWRAAEVVELRPETSQTKTITFDVPGWPGHRAGQHVDVRLTAEDGYQAERSYSIASAADGSRIELTVERLEDGEVSPYLADELRAGDVIELRGPVGGYFVWNAHAQGTVLLVAGGSGIAPLMAMARQRAGESSGIPTRLLYSARTWDDVIYRDELAELAARGDGFEPMYTLTRAQPPDWEGYGCRVDTELLGEVAPDPSELAVAFVCGPTPFVEAVANGLVELGNAPSRIKTERFGPTGG